MGFCDVNSEKDKGKKLLKQLKNVKMEYTVPSFYTTNILFDMSNSNCIKGFEEFVRLE